MTIWTWQGNCINSFDEDGDSLISVFRDASDFACSEDVALPFSLTDQDSLQAPAEVPLTMEFSLDVDRDLLIGYDTTLDIHHFFTLKGKSS